jgi:hypothetical protein
MSAAESVRDARRRLEAAVKAVERAEADIAALAELKAKQQPIVLWARLREDGSVNSQALRVSREGAEGAAKWDRQAGRVVRLLCYVQEPDDARR